MRRDPPTAFVLSAGRTGTVFLTRALAQSGIPVHTVHEPAGSRGLLMLGNLRNLVGVGSAVIRRRYDRALARRLARVAPGHVYVELNPMLCPIPDVLVGRRPLRIVHMVRDPRTWVPSIRAFRASGFRRHLVDVTPLATPYPAPRPPGWLGLSQVDKAIWRWRYCNEQIASLQPHADAYEVVRYEDLFSRDAGVAADALGRAFAALGIDAPVPDLSKEEPANAAPRARQRVDVDEGRLREICGPWLARYGYDR